MDLIVVYYLALALMVGFLIGLHLVVGIPLRDAARALNVLAAIASNTRKDM